MKKRLTSIEKKLDQKADRKQLQQLEKRVSNLEQKAFAKKA